MRQTLLLVLVFLLSSCAPTEPETEIGVAGENLLGGATLASAVRGRDLFVHEEMGGNGRTCESCHTTVERAYDVGYRYGRSQGLSVLASRGMGLDFVDRFATFDLAPDFARILFELDPNDGLFREIDADGGVGSSYEMVQQGLIRVHLTLHSRVHVVDCGPANDCTVLPDGRHSIVVLRSPPTTLNTILQEASAPGRVPLLMWDGRHTDAAVQAGAAFDDHFERTMTPTAQQLDDIAAFERNTFTDLASAYYAATNHDPGLPPGRTASERRGREFFVAQPILASDMAHRGLCAQCHSGPLLNHASIYHRLVPPSAPMADGTCPCADGQVPDASGSCGLSVRLEGPVATEIGPMCLTRIATPNPDPVGRPGFVDRTFVWDPIPGWGPRVMAAHDPGRGGITGDPCSEFPMGCIFASANPANPAEGGAVAAPLFRIASLRGAGSRLHFDHNNIALTPERQVRDVAAGFAIFASVFQAQGDPNWSAFIMSEQDILDCAAYLSLL